jgi:hypothetical protein
MSKIGVLRGSLGEGLVETSGSVLDAFDPHGEANEFGRDAGGGLLFFVKLGMGGGIRCLASVEADGV